MPDTTTVASQMVYGVRLIPGIRGSLGNMGKMIPLIARNLPVLSFHHLHPLYKFGKGVFHFCEKKHGDYHHDIKPGRLCTYDRSHTIGDKSDDDCCHSKHVELGLLDIIIDTQ